MPDGERWEVRDGQVVRTIIEIGDLYDVTVCAAPAYPASDASLARTFLDYATERGLLWTHPDADARRAKLLADLELRRRRLSPST